tara:strand:+ start:61 stop:288 length:228 start_codon:yes stop_codon:yes gene_type:complete
MGEITARAAPNMNTAPVVILNLVNKSERTWDVSTFPDIRLPDESSSLTVTVASPIEDGISVCQTILDFDIEEEIL